MNTKIFCDIAELDQVKKFNKKKIVKGFTTNPSLMKLAGAKNYIGYCKKLLEITSKPISLEVFADDEKNMILQAMSLSKLGANVFVKIPVVNSKGIYMKKVIKTLNKKKIKLNITAVYNHKQTQKILSNIDKKSEVIISIFAGRMADNGIDPVPEFIKSLKLAEKYKNVSILWASVRESYNFIQAKQIGCNMITVPPKIIEKIISFGRKNYKALTVETVKKFLLDSKSSKFKILI
jgi:transaldolase